MASLAVFLDGKAKNRCLQLRPKRNQELGAGAWVRVEQRRDGGLRLVYEGRPVAFEEIAATAAKPQPAAAGKKAKPSSRRTPSAKHPWKRFRAAKSRAAKE